MEVDNLEALVGNEPFFLSLLVLVLGVTSCVGVSRSNGSDFVRPWKRSGIAGELREELVDNWNENGWRGDSRAGDTRQLSLDSFSGLDRNMRRRPVLRCLTGEGARNGMRAAASHCSPTGGRGRRFLVIRVSIGGKK